jgi:very-short-patch-repair endonuclease
MIAIEAEGYEHHGPQPGWQTDMHRMNPLQNLGWIVLRFSWGDVTERREYVISTVEDAFRCRGILF